MMITVISFEGNMRQERSHQARLFSENPMTMPDRHDFISGTAGLAEQTSGVIRIFMDPTIFFRYRRSVHGNVWGRDRSESCPRRFNRHVTAGYDPPFETRKHYSRAGYDRMRIDPKNMKLLGKHLEVLHQVG